MSFRLIIATVGKWMIRIVIFFCLSFLAVSWAESLQRMSYGSRFAAEGRFTGLPFPYACNGGLDGICGSGFTKYDAYFQDFVFWGLIVFASMIMMERRLVSRRANRTPLKHGWLKMYSLLFLVSIVLYVALFFSVMMFEGG